MKDYVVRVNLKPNCENREELMDYCLNSNNQCLAIGWHCVYEEEKPFANYEKFYDAVWNYLKKSNKPGEKPKKINPVINFFRNAEEDDLFWTRDTGNYYWICRATGKAESSYDQEKDIGAILPVEAYKVGMQVPGQIKASFNRRNAGTAARIWDNNGIVLEYSKYIYNKLSGKEWYEVNKTIEKDFLSNLPDFELEELVISYLQIKNNYYVLSNSIANKSTTPKIECELIGRDIKNVKKAVVQVKGPKNEGIDALDYKEYIDKGYEVYLYAPVVNNLEKLENCYRIDPKEIFKFYNDYKTILPKSITEWENIFK